MKGSRRGPFFLLPLIPANAGTSGQKGSAASLYARAIPVLFSRVFRDGAAAHGPKD